MSKSDTDLKNVAELESVESLTSATCQLPFVYVA